MWLVSVAAAQTLSCGSLPYPRFALPDDGQGGVPPEAVLLLDYSDNGPGCPLPVVEARLATDAGVPVEVSVTSIDSRLVEVRPSAPLSPGYYVLTVEPRATSGGSGGFGGYRHTGDGSPASGELWFLVEEVPLPSAGSIRSLDLHVDRRCSSGTFSTTSSGPSSLWGEVQVDPSGRGVLRTRLVSDGVSGPWHTAGLVDGVRTELDVIEPVVLGPQQLCVEAELLDWTLASAGPPRRECFAPSPCPPAAARRRGCESAPAAPGVGLLAALVLAGRRRSRPAAP